MEKESFENESVAALLNESFVAVKVDKEERPDIDAVYMEVCQAFTGQGGWPTTVLTTPEQKPFFAGTYFPRERQGGQPGLLDILEAARDAWNKDPAKLKRTGEEVARLLSGDEDKKGRADSRLWETLGKTLTEEAAAYYSGAFDPVWGGFGSAPKFPSAHNLLFLMKLHEKQQRQYDDVSGLSSERLSRRTLRGYDTEVGSTVEVLRSNEENGGFCRRVVPTRELAMVEKTLTAMYAGGLYDHVGGGFCRYSTDEKWLVPHFEKMLYDNALLAMAYAECWRITKKPLYRKVAEETLDFVIREMCGPEGGFYSAQDADSEGEEGKYYVFTPEEVCDVIGGERGRAFCQYYGITEEGNFEGKSIPNLIGTLARSPERIYGLETEAFGGLGDGTEETAARRRFHREMAEDRQALYRYRRQRMSLHTDDKVLTSWNSLMIAAFARAYRIFEKKEYLLTAQRAEKFLREKLTGKDGSLCVRYRDGESAGEGFLDDYAFYQWALLELLCADHRASGLQRAIEVQDRMVNDFLDQEGGGFYLTGADQERLIFRPKETYDGAMPSGNSAAAYAMVRLCEKMAGSEERRRLTEEQLSYVAAAAEGRGAASSFGLTALLEWERWTGKRRFPH